MMLNVNELSGFGIESSKVSDISYIANAFVNPGNLIMPASAQVGDVAIYSSSSFVNTGTAGGVSVPSGWIDLYNYSTTTAKYRVLFKVLTLSDLGSTIINTTHASVIIYRPNGFTKINTLSNDGQNNISSNPSNQTIPSSNYSGRVLLEMMLYRSWNASAITRGSTYSDIEIENIVSASYIKLKKYSSYSTSLDNTISFSSAGTNRFLGYVLIGLD